MFLGLQPYPSDEDIKSLSGSESKAKARELDTTINRIEEEIDNLPEEKPSLLEGATQQLVFGTRKVKALGVAGTKSALTKLKTYRNKFDVQTTSKREVRETLQPLVDAFENSKSFDDLIPIYRYINTITEGEWGSATQKWMRKLGDIITTTDAFGSAFDTAKLNPDNTGGVVERVGKILGWGLKSSTKDTIEVQGGIGDKPIDPDDPRYSKRQASKTYGKGNKKTKPRIQQTTKTRVRNDPTKLTATRRGQLNIRAVPIGDIELKIQQMKSLPKFRKFIRLLHTSGAANNTKLEPFKEQGIDILHDVAIVSQRNLNDSLRLIDFGRKGISLKHRESPYKTQFAEYYLQEEIGRASGPFQIGNWDINPDYGELDLAERNEQEEQRLGALGWIKDAIKEETPPIFDEFKRYVQGAAKAQVDARNLLNQAKEDYPDGNIPKEVTDRVIAIYKENNLGQKIGAGSMDFFLGRGDNKVNFNDAVEQFPVTKDKVFMANMWAWMFQQYFESDSTSSFKDKINVLSTSEGWTNYIPSGRTFQSIGEESFVNTMKAILSMIILFYDKSFLDKYNAHIKTIGSIFYRQMAEAKNYLEDDEGIDEDEEQFQAIIQGYLEQVGQSTYHTSLMGCKDELNGIVSELNELLLNLDDKVHTVIHEICIDIGDDPEGKYTTNTLELSGQPQPAIKHLIKMGLMREIKGDEEE